MSDVSYVETREQDEYGYWYTRIEGSDGSLHIQMDHADVEKMMNSQKKHPVEVSGRLSMFARMYEKLGNAKVKYDTDS